MKNSFFVYKYIYGDGKIEYIHQTIDTNPSRTIPVRKMYDAVYIKNITTGQVLKDRYTGSVGKELPETQEILDNSLFQI